MINPELRKHIPVLPGKDDVFTKMGLLFIEAYEEIVRMRNILEVSKDPHANLPNGDREGLMTKYMQIIGNYIKAQEEYVETMPARFLEIVKEYQEMLFEQPLEQEKENQ